MFPRGIGTQGVIGPKVDGTPLAALLGKTLAPILSSQFSILNYLDFSWIIGLIDRWMQLFGAWILLLHIFHVIIKDIIIMIYLHILLREF